MPSSPPKVRFLLNTLYKSECTSFSIVRIDTLMKLPTFSEWLQKRLAEDGMAVGSQPQVDPNLNSKIADETMRLKQKNPAADLHQVAAQAAMTVAKQHNKPVTAVAQAQSQPQKPGTAVPNTVRMKK